MFGLSGPLLDACVLSILEGGDAYGYIRCCAGWSGRGIYPPITRHIRAATAGIIPSPPPAGSAARNTGGNGRPINANWIR